jgi:riboflavin kinase / FMN adenylyltransferase
LPSSLPKVGTLCAIGNFDGVHRGHVELLRRAGEEAAAVGLVALAVTFDPPPAVVLGRKTPAALTPLARKIELIEAAVPSMRVRVKAFDQALSESSPRDFAQRVLVGEFLAKEVLVGQNFRFGKGRAGDLPALVALGADLGFAARATAIAGDARGPWSSTRVRASIAAGDWDDVVGVLGRPHALTGVVVRGDQRGRTIGFPTANLGAVEELLPPNGVYAVLVDRLDVPGRPRALSGGVANIGVRPTVGAGPSVEAHLFDWPAEAGDGGDLYGARLRLHLAAFLRPERKFDGLESLKAQIARDAAEARALLAPTKPAPGPLGGWY